MFTFGHCTERQELRRLGLSRVLILFGGRNCDGRPEVSGKLGWMEWADLNVVQGVEIVSAVPEYVRPDARILVLVGGRGWTGTKSIRDLGFVKWTTGCGWCLVAPCLQKIAPNPPGKRAERFRMVWYNSRRRF